MTDARAPLHLKLTFAPTGDGANLHWQADVLGTRTSLLAPPIPPGDLALVLRALDVLQDPCYPYARTAEQTRHFAFNDDECDRLAALDLFGPTGCVLRDAPRRLGRHLFAALTADPQAREALATVRDHATALGCPLSLTLAFPPGTERLAALPWELLWDDGPTPLLLSRGLAGGLTRCLALAQALPPLRQGSGPLRILALSPQSGITPELRQVERAARTAALGPLIATGRAMVEEIEPASRAALVQAIETGGPPDIVHFYGHGRMRDGNGELRLDDPGEAGWLTAGALAALLGGVGLVTLYACHGAGASVAVEGGDPLLGGVAQALVAAGVPAVLGMQLAVRATAATRAAATMYRALADGRGLQTGLAVARRALFVEERDGASWFVPALYLRAQGSEPFTLRAANIAPAQTGANQRVIAHNGGAIRALRLQGRAGSSQRVIAASGGTISDVMITDR